MNKATFVLSVVITLMMGCTTAKPKIVALDNIPSDEARDLISSSVRIVWPDEALRFDDPSRPSPLQIVVPRRYASSIGELFFRPEYRLRLFSIGDASRLTMVHAIAGTKEMCEHSPSEYVYRDYMGDLESGVVIRCGDIVFQKDANDSDFVLNRVAMVAGEVVDDSESFDISGSSKIKTKRILIKYINQKTEGF